MGNTKLAGFGCSCFMFLGLDAIGPSGRLVVNNATSSAVNR